VSRWDNQELIRKAESQQILPDFRKNYYPITIWRYNPNLPLESIIGRLKNHGIIPLLTEEVPTDPSALNALGLESRPLGGITRVITTIENPRTQDPDPLIRREKEFDHLNTVLIKLQKEDFAEREILIPSFSRVRENGFGGGMEIFKGVGTVDEIWNYYRELKDIRAKLWLTHGRFPTLTQLWWGGSHPFQQGEWIGLHNGNIISYDIHAATLKERYALLAGTDSEVIPAMIDYLTKTKGLPLEVAFLALKTPGWAQRDALSPREQKFINELNSTHDDMLLDGPAALIITNGERVYALTGRHGVRPLHVVKRPNDGAVLIASELGVIAPGAVRISQGKIGTDEHIMVHPVGKDIVADVIKTKNIIDRAVKNRHSELPVYSFIDRHKRSEESLKKIELKRRTVREVHQALVQFGCSMGTVKRLEQEARIGAVIIESTGEKKPLPLWRGKDVRFLTFFQIGASEVGDPSIDPDRMPIDTVTHLGQRADSLTGVSENPKQQLLLNAPILFSTGYLPSGWNSFREVLTQAAKTFGTVILDNNNEKQSLPPEMFSIISTPYVENFETSMRRIYENVRNQINLGKSIIVLSDIVIDDTETDVIPATLVVGLVHIYLETLNLRRRVSLVVESLEIASSAAVFKTLTLGADAIAIDPRILLAAMGIGEFHLTIDPLDEKQIGREEAHLRAHNLFTSWTQQLKKLMGGADITDIHNLVGNKLLLQSLGLGKEISSSLGILDDDIGRRNWDFFVRKNVQPFLDPNPAFILPVRLPRHNSPKLARDLRVYVEGGPTPEIPRTDYFDLLDFKTNEPSDINPQTVSLETTLYPFGELERTIQLPLVFGAISLGAASLTFHRILADGAAEVGTFYNTGEGGRPLTKFVLQENTKELGKYLSTDEWTTFQVASGRFGVTMEVLRHCGVIEIKIAQGAKPGIGGHLPGQKVTKIIAETRGIPVGSTAISPATHQDITSIEDLKALINLLREATDNTTPIQVKLAALPGMAWIAVGAVRCGADALVIDGFRGATGAAPWAQQNEVGLPIASVIASVDDILRKEGIRDNVSLIAGGGLRTAKEYLMAVALGADAAMTVTSLKDAVGCTQCGQCHLGICPEGITAQAGTIYEEKLDYDEGKTRLTNYIRLLKADMQKQLARMGLTGINELRGRRDLLQLIQEEDVVTSLDPTIVFEKNTDYTYLARPLLTRSWVGQDIEQAKEIVTRKIPTFADTGRNDLDIFDCASAGNKLVRIENIPGITDGQKQDVKNLLLQTSGQFHETNVLTQKLELNRVCGCIGECIHRRPTDGMASTLVKKFRLDTYSGMLDLSDTPMSGDRYVGVALARIVDEMREKSPENARPIEVNLSGVAGHDLGAFLIPDMTIKIISKNGHMTGVGDGVGKSNQGGTIIVEGSGGDLAGYAMRSGRLYFLNGVDDLVGCNMRGIDGAEGPAIIVGGNVKNRAFEGMSGGIGVVIGHNVATETIVGENFASGIFGGTIYLHTSEEEITKHIHPYHLENIVLTHINPDQEEMLLPELKRWSSEFNVQLKEVLHGKWVKINAKTINPLAGTYAGH
jgi:glutamate synthase domain-containing protein 2/glutamate synthase domain-containing protein 1/glutamate synthase domain-containing protein 3